jgi:hypothetical protein
MNQRNVLSLRSLKENSKVIAPSANLASDRRHYVLTSFALPCKANPGSNNYLTSLFVCVMCPFYFLYCRRSVLRRKRQSVPRRCCQ